MNITSNRNSIIVRDFSELDHIIEEKRPEIIVVEGYNGVGKTGVIKHILETTDSVLYRPDYTSWVQEVPAEFRWVIFSSFMDILTSTKTHVNTLVFDRGFFSGPVYNNDIRLSKYYKELIKDYRVLTILVTCSREDYERFLAVRDSDKSLSYDDCLVYTERYKNALGAYENEYVEYVNVFDDRRSSESKTCLGCSHYHLASGECHNPKSPKYHTTVLPSQERCSVSNVAEVQDKGGISNGL